MFEIIETTLWNGYRKESILVLDSKGGRIPCHILLPNTEELKVPFILATHGATSSKHEWTEIDGYTKGGNLAKEYLANGIAIIAMDWHYHGDNDTLNSEGRNVFSDENFEDFFNKSVSDANSVIEFAKSHPIFDPNRMGFSGYSLAGIFGFWLANHGVDFKAMVLCVPGVNRGSNKYYSTFNNLEHISKASILQISAEKDEYIDIEEAKWLFNQINVQSKKLQTFESGHSLPVDYVKIASAWMRDELIKKS